MFSGQTIDYSSEALSNPGFWPNLDVAEFQRSRAIPADFAVETTETALLATVAEVNALLADVENKYRLAGYQSADQVPGARLAGQNQLVAQYKKAVFARTKADLLGEFATIGRRDSHPGQESEESRQGLLAESSVVIRLMKGLKRVTVKVI